MTDSIKPLKTSTGSAAEGHDKFFKRDLIIRKIRRKLNNNENLLITAPRRIGKTSILKYLRDNPDENQIIKYLIVQSVSSTEEFYKKVFNELIKDQEIFNSVERYLKGTTANVKKYLSRLTGVNIDGVELGADEKICYQTEFHQLIGELSTHPKQIILFIDEFPDALNNIWNLDEEQAKKFLMQHREMREKHSNSKLQFVYTGSTGLKTVVKKMGDLHLINNLVEIKVPPLSNNEAIELIQRLILGKQLDNPAFEIPEQVVEYIIGKIAWLIPYYLQIIIEELFDSFEDAPRPITNESIDHVFNELISERSTHADYFENWVTRLKQNLSMHEFKYASSVLSHIAEQNFITKAGFYDLSVKHKIDNPKYVLDLLVHDGYLITDEQDQNYGFVSTLLKEWWFLNVAA